MPSDSRRRRRPGPRRARPGSRRRGSHRRRTGRRFPGTRRRAAARRPASRRPSPSSARPSPASPCGRGRRDDRRRPRARRAGRGSCGTGSSHAGFHVPLERDDRVLAGELTTLLLERPVPALAAVVDDRDERLPGHVAAEDRSRRPRSASRSSGTCASTSLTVNVRREEDPHDVRDCSVTKRTESRSRVACFPAVERDRRAVDDHRATVDGYRGTVHVARSRPGQKCHHSGDFGGIRRTPQGRGRGREP